MGVLPSLWCFQLLPSMARAQMQRAAPLGVRKAPADPPDLRCQARCARGAPERSSQPAGGRARGASLLESSAAVPAEHMPVCGCSRSAPRRAPAGASVSMRSRAHARSTVFGAALRTTAPRWETTQTSVSSGRVRNL